jgi:Ca-activated chloride channel family protein
MINPIGELSCKCRIQHGDGLLWRSAPQNCPLGKTGVPPLLRLLCISLCLSPLLVASCFFAQTPVPVGSVPLVNAGLGGDYLQARFASLDFEELYLDEQKEEMRKQQELNKKLIDSGAASALDLAAPGAAVREFNQGVELLKHGKPTESVAHLQKAIKRYAKFVSAHNYLGLAYETNSNEELARLEFTTAATLDPKFPRSFINLGRLELSQKNFEAAAMDLAKGAAFDPRDAQLLTTLTYAQHGAHEYKQAIETAVRVHQLDHKGLANVHYIAAACAIALGDFPTIQHEFELFVQEDPTNPLAPNARRNLEMLAAHNRREAARMSPGTPTSETISLANSESLRTQLAGLGDENSDDNCADCGGAPSSGDAANSASASEGTAGTRGYIFRSSVDEVGVFFSAAKHGHNVTDLQLSDIQVLDAGQAPQKVLQFVPQSKLPLHLALLIDTSGSVTQRLSFEKKAAAEFVRRMMNNSSDLAFVAGFSNTAEVTQDFTSDLDELSAGIDKLVDHGGTALFDAASFACWKLAAYPERDRVANVLVVLTDGEDNSSHNTLAQAIRDADTTGVTIYTISTAEHTSPTTEADKILMAMAERSGGNALFPGDIMSLRQSFSKLRDLIRSRYLISYIPADFVPNGKYRPIHIVAKEKGHRLQVHARKGYYARLAAQ